MSNELARIIQGLEQKACVYYKKGISGVSYLPLVVRPSIHPSWMIYSGILEKLKRRGYNPFSGRIYTTRGKKL